MPAQANATVKNPPNGSSKVETFYFYTENVTSFSA